MRGWSYFIPKSDYYVSQFIREARSVGVALTVSLDTLKEMEWKDRIVLMQEGGAIGIKSTVWFAEFPVDCLTGLSALALKELTGKFRSMLCDLGGERIKRGSREFHTGFSSYIDAPLGKIAEALIEMWDGLKDVSLPMIACLPSQIKRVEKPLPIFRDMTPGTGFRAFDVEGVCERIAKQEDFGMRKRPHITGQCEPPPGNGEVTILEEFPGRVRSALIIEV